MADAHSASTEPPPPARPKQQGHEDEAEDEEELKGRELLVACRAGDLQRVQALLAEGAPAYYQVYISCVLNCFDEIKMNSLRPRCNRSASSSKYPNRSDSRTGIGRGHLLPDARGGRGAPGDCAGAAGGGRPVERAGPLGEGRGGVRDDGGGGECGGGWVIVCGPSPNRSHPT